MVPDTIGRNRITRKIGEGGMGIVYAARDERLDRPVAIKVIREASGDARARDRLWREARAAASVNHPNVCQLYEVGEENGELFLAMELMEGESLSARLLRGPLALAEAIQLALAVLGAREALHRRGIVHRDLKPSNIFLTPHGIKLLDFGLARQIEAGMAQADATISAPGFVMGTPGYMAPEQLLGHPTDQRTDLFAVGIVIFEMLAGKAPFAGDSSLEVSHAILCDRPRSLGGSSAIAAVDRVIQRALAKEPDDRYATTTAMAQDLRAALLLDSGETARAHEVTRLIVLPLRILRTDPETDFLAFSLPDAIASTLSGLQSLVVRSSAAAGRVSGDAPDLKAIAADADVNAVLHLRANELGAIRKPGLLPGRCASGAWKKTADTHPPGRGWAASTACCPNTRLTTPTRTSPAPRRPSAGRSTSIRTRPSRRICPCISRQIWAVLRKPCCGCSNA